MCRPNLIFSYLSGTENFAALRLTLPHSRRQSRGHSSFHSRLIVIDDERRDCKWSDANYLRNRRRGLSHDEAYLSIPFELEAVAAERGEPL